MDEFEVVSMPHAMFIIDSLFSSVEEAIDALREKYGLYGNLVTVKYKKDPFGADWAEVKALGQLYVVRSVISVRKQELKNRAERAHAIERRHGRSKYHCCEVDCYEILCKSKNGVVENITNDVIHLLDRDVAVDHEFTACSTLFTAKLLLIGYAYRSRLDTFGDPSAVICDCLMGIADVLSDSQCSNGDYLIQRTTRVVKESNEEDDFSCIDESPIYYSDYDLKNNQDRIKRFSELTRRIVDGLSIQGRRTMSEACIEESRETLGQT